MVEQIIIADDPWSDDAAEVFLASAKNQQLRFKPRLRASIGDDKECSLLSVHRRKAFVR